LQSADERRPSVRADGRPADDPTFLCAYSAREERSTARFRHHALRSESPGCWEALGWGDPLEHGPDLPGSLTGVLQQTWHWPATPVRQQSDGSVSQPGQAGAGPRPPLAPHPPSSFTPLCLKGRLHELRPTPLPEAWASGL